MRILKGSIAEYTEKIKNLHQEGKSSVEIGKILGKDHSTILHWLHKIKLGYSVPWHSFSPKKSIIQLKPIDPRSCVVCGKRKSKKFRKTKYCSLRCWNEYQIKKYNRSEYEYLFWNKVKKDY